VFDPVVAVSLDEQRVKKAEAAGVRDMQDHLRDVQSDAPACNVCGHITVRSGTCYKCLNCGNSLGCS
jgi:ribonucleoside-diphosphate reductase alpha chain